MANEGRDKQSKRWRVNYKFGYDAEYENTLYIDEIEELQDVVEGGPEWQKGYSVIFEIQYNR